MAEPTDGSRAMRSFAKRSFAFLNTEVSQRASCLGLTVSSDQSESIALEWFTQLTAVRFLELNGLLPDRGLSRLYPSIFEPSSPVAERLLPKDLLQSGSYSEEMRSAIPEGEFIGRPEVIGWLYQYYLADRKASIYGRVVAKQDLPVATQLFTPEWLAEFLVHNTLGQTLDSFFPSSMANVELSFIKKPRVFGHGSGQSVRLEDISVFDPACGSGHLLLCAYDLLYQAYDREGYPAREIPARILRYNLFGLDIDSNAIRLAQFCLLARARLDVGGAALDLPTPNVWVVEESPETQEPAVDTHPLLTAGYRCSDIGRAWPSFCPSLRLPVEQESVIEVSDVRSLEALFESGKIFGSLIRIPDEIASKLKAMAFLAVDLEKASDQESLACGQKLKTLVRSAVVLAAQYTCVIANPPYMSQRFFEPQLKAFINAHYPAVKRDLFAAFIVRCLEFGNSIGIMCPFVWMFIGNYEPLRRLVLRQSTLQTLVQLEYSGFDGATVPICAFTVEKESLSLKTSTCIRLSEFRGAGQQGRRAKTALENSDCNYRFDLKQELFQEIPGSPLAYWVSDRMREMFRTEPPLSEQVRTAVGLNTGDNRRFLRRWFEVNPAQIGFECSSFADAEQRGVTWLPYNKGGQFRKWAGNYEFVIYWPENGRAVKELAVRRNKGKHWSRYIQNLDVMFQPGITWTFVSSSRFGVRILPKGFLFDVAGSSAFSSDVDRRLVLAFLCSTFCFEALKAINPTLNFQAGNLGKLPFSPRRLQPVETELCVLADEAIELSNNEWNDYETSWNFQSSPFVRAQHHQEALSESVVRYQAEATTRKERLWKVEQRINDLIRTAYDLSLSEAPKVALDEITLRVPTDEQAGWMIVSYAIGCMFGRYSLATPGLVYDDSAYPPHSTGAEQGIVSTTGIIPLLEHTCFGDSLSSLLDGFLCSVWGAQRLEESRSALSALLAGQQVRNSPKDLARLVKDRFYQEHCKTYSKRPIYWHVISGKRRAFECYVYFHRLTPRLWQEMQVSYVEPCLTERQHRANELVSDEQISPPSSRRAVRQERATLLAEIEELQSFRELLESVSDATCTIDVNQGVVALLDRFKGLVIQPGK